MRRQRESFGTGMAEDALASGEDAPEAAPDIVPVSTAV